MKMLRFEIKKVFSKTKNRITIIVLLVILIATSILTINRVEYENEGKSKSEAKKLAEQWVAIPGTSEHQLGIAVDINADTTKSSSDDVYSWLAENAHKYGFIKRYPSDKTDITGVINEPWHYRYVGKEAALEIYSQGMCLEEYIDTLE